MPLNIFFIRHSKAEPTGNKIPDSNRKLTEEGRAILKAAAAQLKEYVASIDAIISSPLRRALQTAEIIREEFNIQPEIITDDSLLNGGSLIDLLKLADSLEKENIAIVGHQPDISQHISKLISSSDIGLKIPPASIAKISFDGKAAERKGILEFLLPLVKK